MYWPMLLCLAVPAPAPDATAVFLVAGQSNMLNWHAPAAALTPDPADQGILFWHASGAPPSRGLAVPINASSGGKWSRLAPQRQEPYVRYEREFFGPEITLARSLARTFRHRVAIIKVGYFGTSLAADWNPDRQDGNRLYAALLQETGRALEALRESGRSAHLAGFFWMQGETDAKNPVEAAAYGENLRRFIAALRRDLESPYLPFILGRIGPPPPTGHPHQNLVRTAQQEVSRMMPDTAWVDTDDLPRDTDHIHLLAPGVMTLGERWAEAWREHQRSLTESTTSGSPPVPARP